MIWAAVIVAAGRGTRFGRPKQLVPIAGRPMVAWSVEVFASMPEVSDIVIVTEPEYVEEMREVARPRTHATPFTVVAGGPDRQASAFNGVRAVPQHCAGIFIHDGARPLVRQADVRAGMRAVRPGTAALLATRVIDTIKVANPDGKVVRTLERDTLWAAQTPQFATAHDLRAAHAEAARHPNARATDDAALLELFGVDVVVVESPAENFKVTLPSDLERAEQLLAARTVPVEREDDVLLIECQVPPTSVDAVVRELEGRGARIDEIDRDHRATIVHAYADARALRGFGLELHALAGPDALFSSRFSHVGERSLW
jgi:2-C-methyl-D-erythritol 4-phosphate cytidylyltransferase